MSRPPTDADVEQCRLIAAYLATYAEDERVRQLDEAREVWRQYQRERSRRNVAAYRARQKAQQPLTGRWNRERPKRRTA